MKGKKINLYIIIAIFMIVIVCGFAIYKIVINHNYNFDNTKKDNSSQEIITNEYKIKYKSGNYTYDITKKQDNIITIVKSEDTTCDAIVCAQVVDEKYTLILDNEEISDVSRLFDQLFIDTKEREVIVSDSELMDSQLKVINNIIKKDVKVEEYNKIDNDNNYDDNPTDNKIIVNDSDNRNNTVIEDTIEPNNNSGAGNNNSLSYEIVGSVGNCGVYSRGYTETVSSDGYVVTVAAGTKNTGGYTISITSVSISEEDVTIYVTEKTPKTSEATTQVLTQPGAIIRFNRKPNRIIVKNMKTGEIFNKTFPGKEGDALY